MSDSNLQTSGPQGSIVPYTLIQDPGVWSATDWKDKLQECYVSLTATDVDEIKNALFTFKSSGVPRTDINQNVFPLHHLAEKLHDIEKEIRQGRGFVILSGIPLDLTDDDLDVLTINLGISCYLGNIAPVRGSLTTQVRRAFINAHPATPLLNSLKNTAGGYHTDAGGDIIGLLCIRQAHEGGLSSVCSVPAIHNELLRRGRLDIVKTLAGSNWIWDMAMFHPNGAAAFENNNSTSDHEKEKENLRYVNRPVFTYHDGYLSAVYTQSFQNRQGQHALTPAQVEAIHLLEEIAQSEEFCLQFLLKPGDLSLMNNLTMLHARSQFEDTPEEPRHLLRTWVEFDPVNGATRPLPDHVIALRENAPLLQRPQVEDELRSGSSKFLLPP